MSEENMKTVEKKIKKRDITKALIKWYVTAEMCLNFEGMQNVAFCAAMSSILKKLYTKKEDLIAALKRHLLLFNTNLGSAGWILGTTIAMEEERAENPEAVPEEMIMSLKAGLMGPAAAVGDSIGGGIVSTFTNVGAATLAAAGSVLSIPVLLLKQVYTLTELTLATNLTYQKGKTVIRDFIQSNLISDVIEGAGVLGMFMMGVLAASMVTLTTPITLVLSEKAVELQTVLDGIFPGILQIASLMGIYAIVRSGKVSTLKIVIGTLVLSIICAAVGIF